MSDKETKQIDLEYPIQLLKGEDFIYFIFSDFTKDQTNNVQSVTIRSVTVEDKQVSFVYTEPETGFSDLNQDEIESMGKLKKCFYDSKELSQYIHRFYNFGYIKFYGLFKTG